MPISVGAGISDGANRYKLRDSGPKRLAEEVEFMQVRLLDRDKMFGHFSTKSLLGLMVSNF